MNLKISLFPMFSLCVVAQEQANKIRKKQGLVAQPRIIESGTELRYAVNGYCSTEDRDMYDDIETWNVKVITDMSSLFANKGTCNPDINGWDVSQVTNFNSMFYGARSFDKDISGWDVSSGTDFAGMFGSAESFDTDIAEWDVSSGTDFHSMFYRARKFDKDIDQWDVSSGTNFNAMFGKAEHFNKDISGWDVSSGTDFNSMFYGARSFDKDISGWDVSSGTNFFEMFRESAMNVFDPKLYFQKAPPTLRPTGAPIVPVRAPPTPRPTGAPMVAVRPTGASDIPFQVNGKRFTCRKISALQPYKKYRFCAKKIVMENCAELCGLCTAAL